ncbi:Y+L amino acid transporter 2 [Armadillidium nasatum]|uniref:Y+L amino acid transporter 2 n=1 Tax=Armadillidium nasatum TaxID=96803 RepID=A0A5N5T3Y0_9CRUS|nr:Y+L amino acid transporter 2 [Armadillidium nasatum]
MSQEGLLTYINCVSVGLAMRIQTIFTYAKLVALFAIILTGFLHLTNGRENHLNASFNSEETVGGISMALYSGLFAYGGWNYELPRSIWIALPLVTIIYVLANIAYLAVLTPEEIVSSQAVAVLFGQRTLGPLQYTVPVFVALSTFGSLNGILFTSGRLFLTGARHGHLPQFLSYISIKSRTPIPALLLTCFLSYLMIGFGILFLINCLSFVLWLSIGTAISALLWLRYTQPNLQRPIKVNLILPLIFLACCIFLIVVPTINEPESTGLAIILTVAGIPFYMIGCFLRKNKQFLKHWAYFEAFPNYKMFFKSS